MVVVFGCYFGLVVVDSKSFRGYFEFTGCHGFKSEFMAEVAVGTSMGRYQRYGRFVQGSSHTNLGKRLHEVKYLCWRERDRTLFGLDAGRTAVITEPDAFSPDEFWDFLQQAPNKKKSLVAELIYNGYLGRNAGDQQLRDLIYREKKVIRDTLPREGIRMPQLHDLRQNRCPSGPLIRADGPVLRRFPEECP